MVFQSLKSTPPYSLHCYHLCLFRPHHFSPGLLQQWAACVWAWTCPCIRPSILFSSSHQSGLSKRQSWSCHSPAINLSVPPYCPQNKMQRIRPPSTSLGSSPLRFPTSFSYISRHWNLGTPPPSRAPGLTSLPEDQASDYLPLPFPYCRCPQSMALSNPAQTGEMGRKEQLL